MSESATSPVGSVDHLSPPSTSSRLSDSEPDPSDLGDGEEGGGIGGGSGGGGGGLSGGMGGGPLLPPSRHTRGALERSVRSDGASVSSMGSSSRYSIGSTLQQLRALLLSFRLFCAQLFLTIFRLHCTHIYRTQ